MATSSTFSQGFVISFSGTPTIIVEKLNWKNYRPWSNSFLGQGFHDHLEKQDVEIPEENKAAWLKLDYQLCVILWQSMSPELLEILRSFKTNYSLWTNTKDVFSNDVQRLFDSTQKIVSLQQTNQDMVSHIAKAKAATEELKGLLVCNSIEETTNLHPNTQSSASPSVSNACISHSMGSQDPWIVDSGAFDHISGNDSTFSSISSPKFPHFILLANGSKMDQNTGQLIGERHESRGLYYLSNNPSRLCFASISLKLLHNCLRHPSLAKLKLMVPTLNKLSTLKCEFYQLGKHVRSTFPNQINKR
ncbi:hypothetical protein CR513_53859, partial [Mucuna pruriens]